jgi:LPXTG-motif cell wall-anchored protein
MPIPDELKEYGGNCKAAAVVDGELEILPVKFLTIDSVPCIQFTATHFSPYTIYVDTGNLEAGGVVDSNPKTGDGIHPKWFLVIGLVSVSFVLFLKKDKEEKVSLA